MDLKSKIFLISGPTASGKSKFAVKLAKKINGEIINADSMQIYKEFKVLNTRPNKILTKQIRHHLFGIISVKKKFSVARWLKLTKQIIKKISKKNKIPIIVGGTGLYFKSLTEGLVKIPLLPAKIRYEVINKQKKMGQKKFYKDLIKIDPKSKSKINPFDKQRAIRAYEIKKFTNISLFDWFKKTKSTFKNEQFEKIYLDFSRETLIKKIEKRCSKIINLSTINEVKSFKKLNISQELSANNIIGINEISEFLDKNCNLEQAREKILIKTRQYAKRQATWSRGQMKDWIRLKESEMDTYLKKF